MRLEPRPAAGKSANARTQLVCIDVAHSPYMSHRRDEHLGTRNLIEWIAMTQQDRTAKAHPQSGKGSELPYNAAASRRPAARTQDIDHHVGARVRERRIMLGLTQQQLADLIGVTYQQAHKYERGINRVSAGRLYEIAQVLSVPVGYFFDGLEGQGSRAVSPRERMCLELARNFAQIPNERHQEALSQLARVLATD
ncbi:MAG: helix-turn-helix domain-containing protein [Thiohalocapsa sp.]